MRTIWFKKTPLLLITFAALLNVGKSESQLISSLNSGKQQTLVLYGTSLTANGSWVEHLETSLKKTYPGLSHTINSGGAGKNSQWGLQQLEKRVLKYSPDTVFLEFSINDAVVRFDISVQAARDNLETMIERILKKSPDCEIILMTTTPGNKYPEGHRSHRTNIEAYYEMYRIVAKERTLELIDQYPIWKNLQTTDPSLFLKYVPDTIHPNASGCAAIVNPFILKTLGIDASKNGG